MVIHSEWPMMEWMTDLFPLTRSITGGGLRQTLRYLQGLIPELELHDVPSGTQVADWIIPNEWNLQAGWIEDSNGQRIVDASNLNLHVVGYSDSVDGWFSQQELDAHLYSLPELPKAVPYVTSYYSPNWGFCVSHELRESLGPGPFHAVIEAESAPGVLTYGEIHLPGASNEEVLFSTYVCHPSMANDNLSGPVVLAALAQYVSRLSTRKYSYRFVFVPETIGAIAFLCGKTAEWRSRVIAGWVATCLGDKGNFSFLPTPQGDSLSDRVSLRALNDLQLPTRKYTFMDRGSDERQYCAPGVDLPVCSLMRSKYGTFPEYHTSLDDLTFVSEEALNASLELYITCIDMLEANEYWEVTTMGEPHLGPRGLYPQVATRAAGLSTANLLNVWTLCDGQRDALSVAAAAGISFQEVVAIALQLEEAGALRRIVTA